MRRRYLTSLLLGITAVVSFPGAARAYLFYGSDSKTIYIAQPVTTEDNARFQLMDITGVMFWQGAEERLFVNPKRFPHLAEVTFHFDDPEYLAKLDSCSGVGGEQGSFAQMTHGESSAKALDEIVTQLLDSYPNIKTLSIYRKLPISERTLLCVKGFNKLLSLTLSGPLESQKPLGLYLPVGLRSLDLDGMSATSQNCQFPKMGKLRKLWISNCSLRSAFVQQLNTPTLSVINCQDVKIDPDCYASLEKLPSLKEIQLSRTPVPESVLIRWSKQMKVRVQTDHGWKIISESRETSH